MSTRNIGLALLLIAPLLCGQKPPDHDGLARSFFFHAQVGEGPLMEAVKTDLVLPGIMKSSSLDQLVDTPSGLDKIRVTHFIPAATLKQEIKVLPADQAGAALELEIVGRKQTFKRWLVAADPRRDRLSSLIGNWRLVDTRTDKEYERLRQSYHQGRFGHLLLHKEGQKEPVKVAVQMGRPTNLKSLGIKVEVLKFFPHFNFDKQHKPISASPRNLNPAALVKLTQGEVSEERWVFARDFDISRQEDKRLPVVVKLDSLIVDQKAVTSFVLVHRSNGTVVLWSSDRPPGDETVLPLNTLVKIPRSNYSFRFVRHEPHALIEDKWVEDAKGKDTVLQIQTTDGTNKKPVSHWLRLGQPLRLKTSRGIMTVLFAQRRK